MHLCTAEKKQLIEEIGVHLELQRGLPPLASRIYATMIISSDSGFSFEELLSITCSSKSSMSANLNLLTQLGFIEFYTKPGERKRHFRGTGTYLTNTLEDHLRNVEKELDIVGRINTFNRTHNPDKFIADKSVASLFQDYLQLQKKNLQSTIEKMAVFKNKINN